MDCDDVAVLHTKVVSNDSVDANASIIKIVIGQNDKNSVLSLLSANENCVTAEQLKLLHGVIGEGDDRVVIVGGIGDPR